MNEDIRRAVLVLRNSPALSDAQILRILVEIGGERLLAARLTGFLSTAHCRLILQAAGARFLATLLQVLPDGGRNAHSLLNPFGKPPWLLLAQRWNTVCQEKTYWRWLHAAVRLDAANQLLNRGAKLHSLAFAPALLLWPDCGPESETDGARDA